MNFKTKNQCKKQVLLIFLLLNYLDMFCQYNVNGSETWNSGTNLSTKTDWQNGIVISDGEILIIDGITLNFNSTANVSVEAGGHLLISDATLTSLNSTTSKWEGIAAEGYPNEPHFTTEPNPGVENDPTEWEGVLNGYQTLVRLNNSTISCAKYGVVSNNGAIIRARNTNFTNNELGTSLRYFSDLVNACFFMNCEYSWNDDYQNLPLNQTGIMHLKIFNVNNINIGGCQFKNLISSAICPSNRGIGISCTSGELVVGNSGNVFWSDSYGCPVNAYNNTNPPTIGNGCDFNGMQIGIEFSSSYSIPFSFAVLHSSFSNNLVGIRTNNSEKGKVIDCVFTGTRLELNNLFSNSGGCAGQQYNSTFTRTDIDISGSSLFEVIGSSFTFDDLNFKHIVLGTNLEKYCRISGNVFYNDPSLTLDQTDNAIGLSIEGDNNNLLSVQCNFFNDMGVDININPISNMPDLGFANHPAFNEFSELLSNRLRIKNDLSNTTLSYHFFNDISFPRHNPLENSGRSTRVSSIAETTNETNCSLSCEDFNLHINTEEEKSFKIFPNPSTGKFDLIIDVETSSFNVEIFDLNGVDLFSKIFSGDIKFIEFNEIELQDGIYFVRLTDEFGRVFSVQKLMIF